MRNGESIGGWIPNYYTARGMRVVYLSYSIPKPAFSDPGKWLKRIGFSVTVMEELAKYVEVEGIYHIAYRGKVRRNGVTYHFTNYRKWNVIFPIQFNRYIKELRPDVVIVYGFSSPWQIILLRWQVGSHLKIMIEHHADKPLRDIRQYFQRWADRYIHSYFFSSKELAMKWVEKRQIGDEQKIKENAGTSSVFYSIDKNKARSVIGFTEGKIFLWVGRLDFNKDPWLVVRAFERFARKIPDVQLLMIYSSADAEIPEQDFVVFAGNKAIHFLGEVEHPRLLYYYNSADFILSTSHYESHGIAVIEGLSCGCIPILTGLPSFTKITNNGEIGFLYPPGDEDALMGLLHRCLELDLPTHRNRILRYFKERLSSEAIAKNIVENIRQATV